MSIADIKTGGWVINEKLTSTQMNSARAELLKCVDGVGGGTYTPSATVSITNLTVGGINRLKYGSRNVIKAIPFIPLALGDWQYVVGSVQAYDQNVNGVNLLHFALDVPNGGTLESVSATVRGEAGHGGMPTTKPSLTVFRRTYVSPTITTSWFTIDPQTTTAGYEAIHQIDVTGISTGLTGGSHWSIGVRGESGANYVSGLRLLGVLATISFTEQAEW